MFPGPPTDSDIESLIVEALEALPAPFREQLGSVAIVIEDEASATDLASVGAHGLFGLYQGIPRTRLSADGAPTPSKITIYRGPLVRAYPDPAALSAAVADSAGQESLDDRRDPFDPGRVLDTARVQAVAGDEPAVRGREGRQVEDVDEWDSSGG